MSAAWCRVLQAMHTGARLQFRRLADSSPGWDLSCQHVAGRELGQLAPQLDRDQSYRRAAQEQQSFVIDLSLNELQVVDLGTVVDLVKQRKAVRVLVADNRFGLPDLRAWLEANYPEDGLRLLKDGRLSMASTVAHHAVEQALATQALTEAHLERATAAVATLADDAKEARRRRKHMDCGLEEEVNRALVAGLEREGYLDVVEPGFKAVKGVDGKDEYSFDGVFLASRGQGAQALFVGEVKQHLEAHDVRDAEADRRKVAKRLGDIKAGATPAGHQVYCAQTNLLRAYQDAEVHLYVGGAYVLPGALERAREARCIVVQPSGGRFEVNFPAP